MLARSLARDALRAVGLLVTASVVVFAATEALPGDSLDARVGRRADPAALDAARAAAGLDRALPMRWWEWTRGLLAGDPGRSLTSGRPVGDVLAERAGTTTTLAVAALALAVPIALLVAAAVAAGPLRWRRLLAAGTATAAALPPVVVAVGLATVLAAGLGWVPAVSLLPVGTAAWTRPDLLVLPVLALALTASAYAATQLHGLVADAVTRPPVVDARLRGVPALRVAVGYVGMAVAVPAVRVLAVLAGSLVAGTALVETLFGVPGLGELFVAAVAARDTPVVSAVAMLAAVVVAAGFLLADVLGAVLGRAGASWA